MAIPYKLHKNLKLLIDGQESLKRITKRIDEAKKSIYVNMFIWRDDKIGNIIGMKLLDAADRGVKIRISKDRLALIFEKAEENKQSFFHKGFSKGLWFREKIIDTFYFTPGEANNRKQKPNNLVESILTHKNICVDKERLKEDHSKYFIFDDNGLITGGRNIEDRAFYYDVSGDVWADYMIEITGKNFILDLRNKIKGGKDNRKCWFKFILNTKEKIRSFEIKPTILKLLSSAKNSVNIQSAYFGDRDITNKIIEIVNRGITVKIICPKKANLQTDFNHKVMKYILMKTHNRANIYFSSNMSHAKMIDIDEETTWIGSANLTRQSMNLLSEQTILVHGKNLPFSNNVRDSFKDHLKNCEEISHDKQVKFNKFKAFTESIVL